MDQDQESGSPIYRAYYLFASGLTYFVIYFLMTCLCAALIIAPVAAITEITVPLGWILFVLSCLPGAIFFYFRCKGARWRRDNPDAPGAQEANRAAEKRERHAGILTQEAVNGLVDLVIGVFSLALGAAALALVLWLGYSLVTSISTPVAILIGAVIIGICILAVKA